MTSTLRRTAVLVTLALALPGLALAARQGRLIGKVVDAQGNTVPGVTVTTTSRDVPGFQKVTTTDERGVFMVDFERINVNYRYRLEKAGYVTLDIEQKWGVAGTERQEFVLHPGQAPAAGQPPASTSNAAITAFNEGAQAYEKKDHAAAQARFQEALGHDPRLRQAWSALALAHLAQKHYKEAAEAAEKAVELGVNDEQLLRARWEAYRNLGDAAKTQEARAALEKAGRLQEEAKGVYNEGVQLTRLGEDQEAFAKFQQAVEMNPNLEQAWLALAAAALKLNRPADAVAAAEKLLEINPGHQEAVRVQYNAALQVGDEGKIADALVALAAVDRTTARDNLFKLAVKAFDAEQVPVAKARFTKILEIDPAHPRSHYYLGVLLVREGAKKEARAHLEKFIALAPTDPDVETAKGLLAYLTK